MSHRTVTEPRHEYGCDRCGVTRETDGMYPPEWSSVTYSVGGGGARAEMTFRLYCADCATTVLAPLLEQPAPLPSRADV